MTLLLPIFIIFDLNCYDLQFKEYAVVEFYVKFCSEELYFYYKTNNFLGMENQFNKRLKTRRLENLMIESAPVETNYAEEENRKIQVDFEV